MTSGILSYKVFSFYFVKKRNRCRVQRSHSILARRTQIANLVYKKYISTPSLLSVSAGVPCISDPILHRSADMPKTDPAGSLVLCQEKEKLEDILFPKIDTASTSSQKFSQKQIWEHNFPKMDIPSTLSQKFSQKRKASSGASQNASQKRLIFPKNTGSYQIDFWEPLSTPLKNLDFMRFLTIYNFSQKHYFQKPLCPGANPFSLLGAIFSILLLSPFPSLNHPIPLTLSRHKCGSWNCCNPSVYAGLREIS